MLLTAAEKPNVIIIFADDMGSGDIQFLNPQSKIVTPNLNKLCINGKVFTDAHTSSAVCTPSRYSLVTGRYCWRSRLKRGVINGYDKALIEPDRFTVATLFKQQGYDTACIGKWHIGMDITRVNKAPDLNQKIMNGPIDNGFDTFYGISASLDFPPYALLIMIS